MMPLPHKEDNMAASEFQFTLASRGSIIPKIVLSGPSGAGKTTTALLFAYGLIEGKTEEDWQNIVVLDTENRRALNTLGRAFKFEDGRVVKICRFFHAPIEAPYKPDRMIRAMHAAAAVPVGTVSAAWAEKGKRKMASRVQSGMTNP